jgi:hypothetical protein
MSVLDDVDVEPRDDGVVLPGPPAVLVPWPELAAAAGTWEPASPVGRTRIGQLLRLRRRVADLGAGAGDVLRAAALPMALPAAHALHLGNGWVRARVPGGVLDLGVAVAGGVLDLDEPVPLPPAVARAAGADAGAWWPELVTRVEGMGALAAARLVRDAGPRARSDRDGVLRPVGGCDVLTLLASPQLRAALAAHDGSGLRAVAVPLRSRGWSDVARIDPAYVAAVYELTGELERGVDRALIVTRDEVCLPVRGGDVVRHAHG